MFEQVRQWRLADSRPWMNGKRCAESKEHEVQDECFLEARHYSICLDVVQFWQK